MPLKFRKRRKKKEFSVPDYPLAAALDDDVIIEVFYRLPADSLFRFKTVCKQWNKVISSPSFAHGYRRKNSNPVLTGFYFHLCTDHLDLDPGLTDPIFFIADDEISPLYVDDRLTFLPNRRRVALCDSDMGLILYSSTRGYARNFFVCNPLTTQCVALPILPKGKKCACARFMCLGEDKDFHFKVIVFLSPKSPGNFYCTQVEIFSSETGQWKESDLNFSPSSSIKSSSFALFNRIIYWIDYLYMCAFNVDTEQISIIDMPEGLKEAHNQCLRVSSGSLYLTLNKDQDEESDILIWVFNDKGDIAKWTLQHSVSISTIMEGKPEILDRVNYYKKCACEYSYSRYFFATAIHHMNPHVIFLKLPGLIVLYDIDSTISEVVWDDEEVCVRSNRNIYYLNILFFNKVYPFALPAWPIEIPAFTNARYL